MSRRPRITSRFDVATPRRTYSRRMATKVRLEGRNEDGELVFDSNHNSYYEAVRHGQAFFGRGNFHVTTGNHVPSYEEQMCEDVMAHRAALLDSI